MKKPNFNICSNCGSENPLYQKNCVSCKHYMRATVVNIDLWQTFYYLFENPQKALTNIIYAEHKNFLIFLLLFVGLKFLLFSFSIQSWLKINITDTDYFVYNFMLQTAIYLTIILLLTKILTFLINTKGKSRYKDNLAIIVYSFTPLILSLFILTPVEYGIFGVHWFLFNPSPFIIKETIAYILIFLEISMIIWSLYIQFQAYFIQSKSSIFSFFMIVLFYGCIISAIIFIPYILF